jgi:hypothetical protein
VSKFRVRAECPEICWESRNLRRYGLELLRLLRAQSRAEENEKPGKVARKNNESKGEAKPKNPYPTKGRSPLQARVETKD